MRKFRFGEHSGCKSQAMHLNICQCVVGRPRHTDTHIAMVKPNHNYQYEAPEINWHAMRAIDSDFGKLWLSTHTCTLDQINWNNCRNVLRDSWWRTVCNMARILYYIDGEIHYYFKNGMEITTNEVPCCLEFWLRGECAKQKRTTCQRNWGNEDEDDNGVCLIETKRGHIKFYWWQYDKQATLPD